MPITIVAINDVLAVGLTAGTVVTDDPSVVAANPAAVLKATVYVQGLLSGNLSKSFVVTSGSITLPSSSVVSSPSSTPSSSVTSLAVASTADATAGVRDDVVMTPLKVFQAIAAYLTAHSVVISTSASSTSGGGTNNTANFGDSNNAYLVALGI